MFCFAHARAVADRRAGAAWGATTVNVWLRAALGLLTLSGRAGGLSAERPWAPVRSVAAGSRATRRFTRMSRQRAPGPARQRQPDRAARE